MPASRAAGRVPPAPPAPRPTDTLTAAQARRVALAAQGLGSTPSGSTPSARRLAATLGRLGAIQIDSINVVARSHELVLAARTGTAASVRFDRLVYRDRAAFEYWGHAASFLPIETYRLFLPRMARMAAHTRGWFPAWREEHQHLYPKVLERITAEGPLPASAFRDAEGRRRDHWGWNWTPAKYILEDLFDTGVLMVTDRVNFERRYDLTERVLPSGTDTTTPTEHDAAVALTQLAAGSLGVATAGDLADYFRLPPEAFKPALADAAGSGLLVPVTVQGWRDAAYMLPGTAVPARTSFPPVALSPFDSLIWHRPRAQRLFGFTYRLEIYVPAARRVHGYYTMPVLAAGKLVARIDPKHDRANGRLLLRAVHPEPGDPSAAMTATAQAAWRLAAALGARDVHLDGAKDPDGHLTRALEATRGDGQPVRPGRPAGAAG
jgi:uncharacterized protein YcaQ